MMLEKNCTVSYMHKLILLPVQDAIYQTGETMFSLGYPNTKKRVENQYDVQQSIFD